MMDVAGREGDAAICRETSDRVGCSGAVVAGGCGDVSVRERTGVHWVCVGLGDADGESDGARGACVEEGDYIL